MLKLKNDAIQVQMIRAVTVGALLNGFVILKADISGINKA